jgi:hypothetical protein
MKPVRNVGATLVALLSGLAVNCGGAAPSPQLAEQAQVSAPPPAPRAERDPFAGCKGEKFRVDYLDTLDAIADGALAQQEEQLRDWLWTALLGRLAARSSAEDVFTRSLLDLPARRLDGLPRVLRGAEGKTRATTTETDEVVVLVDRSEPGDSSQLVLDAIDAEAMRLGHMPERAHVYGYVLEPRVAKAAVCQVQDLTRKELESKARGFRAATVTSAQQLDTFLAGGVDLLSARCDAGGLALRGRHRTRAAGAPLSSAHVAVLANAYREAPYRGVGFSLDPNTAAFDVAGLRADLSAMGGVSAKTLPGVVNGWKLDPTVTAELLAVAGDPKELAKLREFALLHSTMLESIADPDPASIERVMLRAMTGVPRPGGVGAFADALLAKLSRQCPRYEGALRGTEVGMTLYYTDLIAKLWAQNWRGSAPESDVAGFKGAPSQPISTNNCDAGAEEGRLWFGVRSEGVLGWPTGAMSFQPQSTRLFGKAQGFFEEVDFQGQDLRVVLQWWDRHYAEIASHEPQYELLNQIMKWSAFLATSDSQPECVARLLPQSLPADQHFARWAANHRELRFGNAAALVRAPSECVGLYSSDVYNYCGGKMTLSGGVSLADSRQLSGRLKPASLPRAAERVDISATPIQATDGRVRYALLDRPDATLKNVAVEREKLKVRSTLVLEPKQLTRGGRETWLLDPLRPSPVEREVQVAGGKLESSQRLSSFGAGHLTAKDLLLAEVRLTGASDPVQTARSVADRVLEKRVQGKSFEEAVAAAFPKGPVEVVREGEAWIPLFEGDNLSGYGVISSGGGNRGPPGFVIGASTGGLPGDSTQLSGVTVAVELRVLDAAARQRFAGLAGSDVWLTEADRAARQGDVAGATKLLAQQLATDPSLAASPSFQRQVLSTRVVAARSGKQDAGLEHLQMLATLRGAVDRSNTTSARELKALGKSSAVYAPLDFPSTADLPPISHPPGFVPPANKKFVSRVVDAAYDELPHEVSYAKRRLSMQGGRGGEQGANVSGGGGPGAAQRLTRTFRRPIVIISRCDDDDEGLPPCHCSDIGTAERRCDQALPLTVAPPGAAP